MHSFLNGFSCTLGFVYVFDKSFFLVPSRLISCIDLVPGGYYLLRIIVARHLTGIVHVHYCCPIRVTLVLLLVRYCAIHVSMSALLLHRSVIARLGKAQIVV